MKCVNKSHKDFKFLAEHNNVSVDMLEVITHKYWLETGTEDYFPSQVYIQGQLGKGQYEEHSKAVKDLWESDYSVPKEFTSQAEFNAAYEKATRYFPDTAISFYKNFKDNYVLTVKKPVEKVNASIKDFVDKKSYDAQELADYNLVKSGNYRTAHEQFALDKSITPLQTWEREVLPEVLKHGEDMLLPVKYKEDMEKYFKEHPNSFIQQAIEEQREMATIKEQAIANGTFMKAPNGKSTNLNERQWLQVRTKNFINWFGDWINDPANASKVVDENGEPLVVYHFTDNEFPSFKDSARGLHFTSDSKGEDIFYPNPNTKKISMPIFLNIKNPAYEWDAKYWLNKGDWDTYYKLRSSAFEKGISPSEKKERLQKANSIFSTERTIGNEESGISALKKTDSTKDGIIRDNDTDYIAFNPNQIKSATDNNGMFSTENDDIRMAIENTSKGRGVTIQTEALNITGNKFKNSLYRGQGYAPVIDAEGNLHLHTNYDSLSKLRTLSFDSTIEGAEHYGNRSARHPYIIEVDEEFLDTVVPKGEYEREKVNNGESFRYDEEFNEVRLSFKDELIIPKGKFNITQSNETLQFETFDDVMANIGWLQSLEERAEIEEYNGASEITGRIHENDLKSLSNALDNTLGTYEGYDVAAILYDALALQNDTPGSPIAPSKQYKEFIDKGLIEREYHEGYTYYKPSKALINHLTKKLGLKERQDMPQPVFYQNPHTPFAPYSNFVDEELPFFKTPSGEIYGFVDKEGNIYLDETIIHPEHPIHEYTHLWDRMVAKKDPKLWKRGIDLMKKTSLWEQYANDENYGQKWKATKGMTDEKFDSLVASEVHARLVGKEGSRLLEEEAKKNGAKGIVGRLRAWLLDMFRSLKATFSDWSDEEINKLSLDDYVNMTVRDFFDGINFREKNGQQQFTFRDGVTVTAPFSPNFQQVDALNFMSDFLKSDETTMTLSGYAGTGKTSLMEMIAQKMRKQNQPVMFCATTNKAAAVLNDRVSKSGFNAQTLHKVFGINVEVDESKSYDAKNLISKPKELDKINIWPETTVIIDEASMINKENYKTLNDIARKKGLKIIYVGDEAQLPPVNEDQISEVFRNNNGNIRKLTIVERTNDNAILKEATDLRNNKPLSGESSFNKQGRGVAYIPQSNKAELRKIIEQFVPKLKKNPDYFRILAYHNDAVSKYNEAVRAALGYTDNTPRVNEPIVGYANWGYVWDRDGGRYKFVNSEAYKIIHVDPERTVYWTLEDGSKVPMVAIPVTIQDSSGKKQTLNFMDIKGNNENRENAIILAKEKQKLWNAAMKLPKGKLRTDALKTVNSIEEFLFVNDNIIDTNTTNAKGQHPTLQAKVFDYGYAMTVHKSQGSTFTHVMMDDVDISKAQNRKQFNRNYEGEDLNLFGQAEEYAGIPTDTTDFGEDLSYLADENSSAPESTQQTTEATDTTPDIKQQLRYVAMSRATDTVTVISNNVKKEGSPLGTQQAQASTETQVNQTEEQAEREGYLIRSADKNITEIIGGKMMIGGRAQNDGAVVGGRYEEYKVKIGDVVRIDNVNGTIIGFTGKDSLIIRANDGWTYKKKINLDNSSSYAYPQNPSPDKASNSYEVKGSSLNEERVTKGVSAQEILNSPEVRVKESKLFNKENILDVFNDVDDSLNISIKVKDSNKIIGIITWAKGKYWEVTVRPKPGVKYDNLSQKENDLTLATFAKEETQDIVNKFIPKDLQEYFTSGQYKQGSEDTVDFLEALENEGVKTLKERVRIYNTSERAKGIGHNVLRDNWDIYTINPHTKEVNVLEANQVQGENITSKGSEFAKKLTNPGNNLEVIYKGKTFRNAEHAYQTWKSGEFDEVAYKSDAFKPRGSKPVNKQTNYQTMVEIITAKLQQHPELVQGITERGGEAYLKASTHDMIGDKYWETKTGQNKFIEALTDAYRIAKEQNNKSDQVEKKLEEAAPSNQLGVSLPNYARLKNLQENITVDADWKVKKLQELDSKLSSENAEQENKDILFRMDKVINAIDEEDYYGNLTKQETAVLEKKLGTLGLINKQIRDIRNSNRLPQSEIPHVAELAMNAVSDFVTDIQKNPSFVEEWFPTLKTELDFKTATRKQIIETITLNRLLDKARELFNSEEVDFDPSTGLQADLIYDNFYGIIQFGTHVFAMNEGFGIKKNLKNDSYEITEGMNLDPNDFNRPQDTEIVEETEGDEQEHWQIEMKTLDVLNSASELVRMAIHDCYQLDSNNNPIISKWGIKERMNPHEAVYSILAWTRGSFTLPDMLAKMSEKQKTHKWLSQLTGRLQNKTGEEADFQSQFFNAMCKTRQRYSITQMKDGKFVNHAVNEHPSWTEIKSNLETQFNMGEHPLFTDGKGNKKINTELLGNSKTTLSEKFNLHKAHFELSKISKDIKDNKELTDEDIAKAKENITEVCRVLGYMPSKEVIEEVLNNPANIQLMTEKLGYIVRDLDNALKTNSSSGEYNPFKFKSDNDISGTLKNFYEPITDVMDEVVPNMVYEDGKMYQQYVTPSFLSMLIEKFHWDSEAVEDFMDRTYGQSQWFNSKKYGWRGGWIELLRNDPKSRSIISHTAELNFNKKRYMKTMSPADYTLSMMAAYWAENTKEGETTVPAWYRVPMQSNKPSNEYIRFWSYRGSNYKDFIINGGYDVKSMNKLRPGGIYAIFLQELDRIDTVRKRNLKKGMPGFIKNFDTLGREFCYLPFLNDYLRNSKGGELLKEADGSISEKNAELAKLLQQKVAAEKALTAEEEARLMTLVQDAIRAQLEERTASILAGWEKNGILEAAKDISGIGSSKEAIRANLENFIWNDHYAALNMLEMTLGDIACYKDADDLQKRLAQLHAPGVRANIYATDYKGNLVSDGKYRTLILKDFDAFISNIVENLNEIFGRKIEAAKDVAEKEYWKALKHKLTRPRTYNEDGSVKDQGGDYWNINVADAQGFSSPSSYRKKALMFGRWSEKAEKIYQKLRSGDYRFNELETAFQPLKPFVYGQLQKNMGVENAPIQIMPIPFQAKNAEYLLIMADALLQGENTSKPNLLRAVYNIMEDSEKRFPTKGIDTVQFESSIKSGLQTPININQFLDMQGGEQGAYTLMHSLMYKENEEGELVYNTDSYVYELPYEHYCLQQEIPAHFKNHEQSQGSQERMIIPSDLEFADQEKARQYRAEIENLTAENINISIDKLKEELKLDVQDKRAQNLALSEILQKNFLDSSRYGVEMFVSCGINEQTGDFVIPKGDPIQAKPIEQLVNSLIKNRVNKQEIAGGPIVQVSNFGTSKQLHIRFKDKHGGLLLTEEEYNKRGFSEYVNYKDYVHHNQAGVAYYEVFAPIWTKDLYNKFADRKGNIDVGAIELFAPELLKMISYRIPTEDKYSIAPMKVVGFLPREAGDAIMFPYELTGIDGSDFDVDKRYVMLWDYQIASRVELEANESMDEAEKNYIKHNSKNIVDHLINSINLSAKANAEEIEAIEKEANADAEFKKKTAKRIHEEKLQTIERRNSMIEDALINTKYSNNEEKDAEIYDKKSEKQEKSYDKAIEKEEQRYQAKLDEIEAEKQKTISEKIAKLEEQKVKDRIYQFLKVDRFNNSSMDDALTREIRKAYLNYMYKLVPNPDKRAQNNNKILDKTWEILTDESIAHQLLNPGGFDDWKKAGYTIAAYKANPNASWEELQGKQNDDLSKMFKKNLDLTYIDAQIQYYKQNAAAASLLGIFAVNKTAHAILESDNILIAVNEFCNTDEWTPIRIAGFTFGGFRDSNGKPLMSETEYKEAQAKDSKYADVTYSDYLKANIDPRFTNRMFIDPRYDKNGKLIGKTLGSGVGASADAAKDPFLDLINVNLSTVNVLNTMIRLGMPFEDAALFLSQNVISDILEEFNKENLSGWQSLDTIINKKLLEISDNYDISEDAAINAEELSKEELISALRKNPEDRVATDYKVLKNFQRLKALAEGMRNPTFATRFNSVSSAVGPLIIDNLILESKRDNFKQSRQGQKDTTGFYTVNGDVVDINYIFDRHPILKAFAQTLEIADQLFRDMPAGSTGFRNLLDTLPDSIKRKIYSNKDLFSSLSNFYQSHMLVNAEMVDPSKLEYYIEEFPKKFVSEKYKEKYPDNTFIQGISYTTSSKTGRTFLNVNVVGEEQTQKDIYSSGLIDLYKENPELALDFFNYFFFRGGINFTPKTAMGLFTSYIKERLSTTKKDGTKISYVDVYKKMESSSPKVIVDQFIRNNWNDSSLVPKKKGNFKIQYENGKPSRLIAYTKEDMIELEDVNYMRTTIDKKTYLWKLVGKENDAENKERKVFTVTTPLGDNNEYLEMSKEDIEKPMSDTILDIEDDTTSDIQKEAADNPEAIPTPSQVPNTDLVSSMDEFINGIVTWSASSSRPYSRESAENINKSIEANPEAFSSLIKVVLDTLGVHRNEKEAVEFYKKLC